MSILALGFFKKEKILVELDNLELQKEEKDKLLQMSEELAELRLLDLVLKRLEARDKELFIEQLHGGTAEIAAEFLREKIENIEEILSEHARVIEAEILEDIRSLQEGQE